MRAFPRRVTVQNRDTGRGSAGIRADMSALWLFQTGSHAGRCLPVLLRMRRLQGATAPGTRRLLRILFVRLGSVPAHSRAAFLLRMIVSEDLLNERGDMHLAGKRPL